MMRNKKLRTLVSAALVVGSVILLSSSFIHAENVKSKNYSLTAFNKETDNNTKPLNCKNAEEKKAALDKLVKDKTITQEQEDRIIEYMNEKKEKREAEKEKMKSMTEAERKEYLSTRPRNKSGFLKDLVDGGVITKAQASAIKKALPARHHKGHGKSLEQINGELNKLVQSQTITKDQEDKIMDYLSKRKADRKAEIDKIKNMTEEERTEYFKTRPKENQDFFKELVDNKIIDENQAEAIKKAITGK